MTAVWGSDVKAKFKRQYKSLDSNSEKGRQDRGQDEAF